LSKAGETIAEFEMPADEFTFGAMVLQNELKNVIAATIAMAIVVLMLWVFFFALRP
jgi:hypothetical protein